MINKKLMLYLFAPFFGGLFVAFWNSVQYSLLNLSLLLQGFIIGCVTVLEENLGKETKRPLWNFVQQEDGTWKEDNTIPIVCYKKPIKKRIHRKIKKKPIWNKGKKMSKIYKDNISKGMKKMWKKRR